MFPVEIGNQIIDTLKFVFKEAFQRIKKNKIKILAFATSNRLTDLGNNQQQWLRSQNIKDDVKIFGPLLECYDAAG